MYLYIRQKMFSFSDRYSVFNQTEEPVYNVEGEIFTLGAKIHLYNLAGYEEFYIQQRLFRFLPQYEIYKGDTLCAVISKKFTFFSHQLEIQSSYGDFQVEGNPFGMDFLILVDGRRIGEICKRWFTFGDSYELSIDNDRDAAFFCALVIAIDHCIHNGND